jgi:PAS domain S-box-containing protein
LPATFAGGTVAQAGVSDAAFKAVFDLAPEAIALARLGDGVILEVNAEWQALTGFSRAEVLDRTARD